MNVHDRVVLATVLIGVVTASVIHAQSKKIERSALPPAVEKTVAAQSQGATIRGLSTVVEASKRTYELELTINSRTRDLEIDEQGAVLETEDEIALDAVPPAVKVALTKAAGKGTIEKVETLTKKSKLVAYEADVRTGTRHSEIQVGPDGRKLAHPE